MIRGTLKSDAEIVQDLTRQIESLKEEIKARDETLSRLKVELEDLRAIKYGLQNTLESKNQEIEALKNKDYTVETNSQNFELECKDVKDQNDENNKKTKDLQILFESKDKDTAAVSLDEEITDLKREFKDLKDQNDKKNKEIEDLKISLKLKDEQIKALRTEVKGLKEENKNIKISLEATIRELQNEVKSFKLQTEVLKKEWDDEKEARKKSEKGNDEMKSQIEKLSKDIRKIKEKRDQKEEDKKYPDSVDDARIVLGEMCSRMQSMMYQKVFPDEHRKQFSYTVKYIKKDIKSKKGDDKDQAQERWDALKKELQWNDTKHFRILKDIKEKRNYKAHPDLTKELLLESAKVMQKAGELCGRMSLSNIHEIINMWDLLNSGKVVVE